MAAPTWVAVPDDSPFGVHNLPYGVFTTADRPQERRIGVAIGDHVLDVGAAARSAGAGTAGPEAGLLTAPTLNPLLAAGRSAWTAVRSLITAWLTDEAHRATVEPHLLPRDSVTLHLAFDVADYVDFYASEHHATNVGRIFRPDGEPLPPNWKHLPIGYHGRSGTVVVSGTPVVRPNGQRRGAGLSAPSFGPCERLDFEAEIGFVVGGPTAQGEPVPLAEAEEHVFGVCLLNDWSARDIQAWETVPLGPFLGKSFATSVSPWIVPLDALSAARVDPPPHDVGILPYLDDRGAGTPPRGLDIAVEVRLRGEVVSRPPFSTMYWTYAQMVTHMTVNGASLRAGDLFGSGTVSGPRREQRGALIELTWNGEEPLVLADGTKRTFLEDGDELVVSATAPGPDGTRIGFGEVAGRVVAGPELFVN